MSLADFDERDLDRLADYLAGELPGPAAAEVERLLRTEPAWSQAYAELSGADRQIQALLRADGRSQIEPMPADVIARVDAALAGVARLPGSGPAAATSVPARRATPPSSADVVFLDAQRRRRRRQWLSTAAAVVVGIGLCTGAVTVLRNQSQNGTAASGAAAGAPQNGKANDNLAQQSPPRAYSPAPQGPAPSPTRSYGITQSGINYTPETLRTSATRGAASSGDHEFSGGVQPPAPSPTLLPNGLDACLAQVTAIHPGTIASVDYAKYESQPAVIIVIQRPSGPIVVAAGATCGAPGPDELAAVAG